MWLESLHWDECQGLIDQIQTTFGRLDGLLHNAAHLHGLTPLSHFPIEEWYRTLQVNLNAPFLLTRCCLPLLMASRDASVLFTRPISLVLPIMAAALLAAVVFPAVQRGRSRAFRE